jgi:hypothetical protein
MERLNQAERDRVKRYSGGEAAALRSPAPWTHQTSREEPVAGCSQDRGPRFPREATEGLCSRPPARPEVCG